MAIKGTRESFQISHWVGLWSDWACRGLEPWDVSIYCMSCDTVGHLRVLGAYFIWAKGLFENKDTDIYLGIGTSLAYLTSSPNILLRKKLWGPVPAQPRRAPPRTPCCKNRGSACEPSSVPRLCPRNSQLLSWALWWDSSVSALHCIHYKVPAGVCRWSRYDVREEKRPHVTLQYVSNYLEPWNFHLPGH